MELGQLLALFGILIVMGYWRRTGSFLRHAYTANVALPLFCQRSMELTPPASAMRWA